MGDAGGLALQAQDHAGQAGARGIERGVGVVGGGEEEGGIDEIDRGIVDETQPGEVAGLQNHVGCVRHRRLLRQPAIIAMKDAGCPAFARLSSGIVTVCGRWRHASRSASARA